MANPTIGSTLLERYRIERDAGRTDAGVVFDCVELATGRDVVLEIATQLPNDAARAEIVRDAMIAERLEGEHVLKVLDAGTLSDGVPYLVREPWIEQLSDEVARRGPIPVQEAVGWTLEILEALAEAHAIGMAHGDVRPENAVLARNDEGEPVAKLRWTTAAKAEGAAREDVAADIAGAAGLLRFLLTGGADEEAEGAKTIPNDLARVIARGLHPSPGEEYRNVAELAVDLAPYAPNGHRSVRNIRHMLSRAGIISFTPSLAVPPPRTEERPLLPTVLESPRDGTRRVANKTLVAVALVAIVVAAIVASVLALRGTPPPLVPTENAEIR